MTIPTDVAKLNEKIIILTKYKVKWLYLKNSLLLIWLIVERLVIILTARYVVT